MEMLERMECRLPSVCSRSLDLQLDDDLRQSSAICLDHSLEKKIRQQEKRKPRAELLAALARKAT
ncbi:MAG: hypothetical protein A3G45_00650 [Candidatus Staskawiczbacteria bacterium RIFCSPLOWO2_12_FULL_37_15]|uniref:Uncharacterized protein n=1 Tax=Candidatus Staskawiczbacteria bacterium RIFCSPLOWO2_12_FULL_37_15 TaxID=1802218 RepID=A0A1G2IS88_9BACT|nr:MAG: hypothetical protein A3G45_00650 [Candidatus Staskawiczbacteria bacterium RIFCSPLOWO2_12_FULL_37_15]